MENADGKKGGEGKVFELYDKKNLISLIAGIIIYRTAIL